MYNVKNVNVMKKEFKMFGECSICYRELGYDKEREEVYFGYFVKIKIGERYFMGRLLSKENFEYFFDEGLFKDVLEEDKYKDDFKRDSKFIMIRK